MARCILHCDMNNFYASVECMLNPSIKNLPVAVCGSVEERHGIVLAKNYLAKAYDVKTGEAVWQAKQKCPGLVVVPPHYEEYIRFSKAAREIYARYTDLVEPYGMDECWLDVTGSLKLFGSGVQIANEIREDIKFELGLTVSVGVSFNKIFAKLGSDLKKPDAVTEITQEGFKEKIWKLPACELLYVGRQTKKILDAYCIYTIGDLANTSEKLLSNRLGKAGVQLKQFANGIDFSPVHPLGFQFPVKSVGHGITTTEDMKNSSQVWQVILELCQEIGHKLRQYQKRANGVAIHVRDTELFVRQWQTKLTYPTQSPLFIARAAFLLFEKRWQWSNDIRSITVQAIYLTEQDAPVQLDLFTDIKKTEKQERLDRCVELIRNKFGDKSIQNAVLYKPTLMPPAKPEITMPGLIR